jgi:protein-S-isoprenylcysteine O-methyltransferase Ste14
MSSGQQQNTLLVIAYTVILLAPLALTWFLTFSINVAFWIGICIIIFGEVVFAFGFIAMREHPEKKQALVDWGIYKISRHSHMLAGIICFLGVVIMGWNPNTIVYIGLCIYFVLFTVFMHLGVLDEEKLNAKKLGKEYTDYMKRVPRYLWRI